MKTSIIVPAYNEEDGIRSVVEQLKMVQLKEKEIVVVDDGSRDDTYKIAKSIGGIKLVRHKRNMGKAAALMTGLENSTGQVMVTIDADCTYPAKYIPAISHMVASGRADMVIASRFLGKKIYMPRLNRLGNMFFSEMISVLTSKKITDGSSGMRALTRDVWKSLNVKSRGLDWEVEMTTRVLRSGYRVMEFPIDYYDRKGMTKLHPVKDGMRFFMGIIRGRFL